MRFNAEKINIPHVEERWACLACKNNLNPNAWASCKKLRERLREIIPMKLAALHVECDPKIRAEEEELQLAEYNRRYERSP